MSAMSGFSQQKFSEFRFWEDSLIRLRNEVMTAISETQRFARNEDFIALLEEVLYLPDIQKFNWDSVKNFSVIESSDKRFKLFTWAVIKDNESVENFGFLQLYNPARYKYVLFPLYDSRKNMDVPETFIGDHNAWYGAIYYKIIPLIEKNKTYYTLLGFNANNLFTNQKIIDILHFKDEGKKEMSPLFGAKVFKNYAKNRNTRIIFEYNKNANMLLSYDKQAFRKKTGKKDPKTRMPVYERVIDDLIVFEELIPLDESLPKIAAYMVPEISMIQGFVAEDGYWVFIPRVDASNPDKKLPPYVSKHRIIYNSPSQP